MTKAEAVQILDRLIFAETDPDDWVQDVWGLSPLLGDGAARLFDAYRGLIECCPPEQLENFVQTVLAAQIPD